MRSFPGAAAVSRPIGLEHIRQPSKRSHRRCIRPTDEVQHDQDDAHAILEADLERDYDFPVGER